MANWIKGFYNMYKVNISELDNDKAVEFAKKSIGKTDDTNNLYDRYGYDYKTRVEVVRCGKLAEEAFSIFLKNEYNIDMDVDYEIYEGIHQVDKNDVFINGLNIDIKASKDTQKRGIQKCLKQFNFPVPRDQKIKDITVSVIYDFEVQNFYIAAWIDKDTYETNAIYGTFPGGNGKKIPFYKYALTKGCRMSSFGDLLGEDNWLVKFLTA